MAELKTKRTDVDVVGFLNAVKDPRRKKDAFTVLEVMRAVTQRIPRDVGTKHRRIRLIPLRLCIGA